MFRIADHNRQEWGVVFVTLFVNEMFIYWSKLLPLWKYADHVLDIALLGGMAIPLSTYN